MALGKLGWTEYQYYTCSPEGFYYACKGYYAKIKDQSIAVRNSTAILFALLGGKGDLSKYWPLNDEDKEDVVFEQPDKEMWDKIRRVHKIKT